MVIDHGLEQQRSADKRADRIAAQRDHIDGVPSAADIRRAATRREQFRTLEPLLEHELPTRPAPGIEM
ncbi:MAG: hypothetical protein J2P57_09035 [Acidimicrobiaceae bacterium]|nr:hypothetical protein [Acidimicrobiaceae bacterium]